MNLKIILTNRVGRNGEALPHLRLVDTSTGAIYDVLDVQHLPPAWRPGSTMQHETSVEIE